MTLLTRNANTQKRAELSERITLLREKHKRDARQSFWRFCQIESPDFYTENNWHLRVLCEVLQHSHDRTLDKAKFHSIVTQYAATWYEDTIDWEAIDENTIFRRIIINIPPRTGKSRTLVNFCKWAFGVDNGHKIITGSYNDDMAQDFSRYTRDGIQEERTYPTELIYNDVFPETKIKRGNASYGKWALSNRFFSYKGSGVGGSVTGKGCDISIVDDPVKDAAEAFNKKRLEFIWLWYSSTFNSRLEKGGMRIVNMTRWATDDICGRLTKDDGSKLSKNRHKWLSLVMPARDDSRVGATMHMLCPDLLDLEMYEDLEATLDPSIFNANYRQQPVDIKGRLYSGFQTYNAATIPRDISGNVAFDEIISYTDTADEGTDSLSHIVAGIADNRAYVLDIVHTKEPMEITEPLTAASIDMYGVTFGAIESNNGGRGFARAVRRHLLEDHANERAEITWFTQSKNKHARIRTNATLAQRVIMFPEGWEETFKSFNAELFTYLAEGGAEHDDAADALTGLTELISSRFGEEATAINMRG